LNERQTTVEYKDEKIEGDKATLKVKTSYGTWETLPFVKEDGVWKIDKAGYANKMMEEMDNSQRQLDQLINGGASATPPANY
jgi:hypothetical protein